MTRQPFDGQSSTISEEQLADLKEIHEGWYIEYKSDLIDTKKVAKSLSAFANQHGGWLFFGVAQDAKHSVAATFPGIDSSNVDTVRETLRNASKDVLHPPVQYRFYEFNGPQTDIDLPEGKSIVAVRVPESVATPHVHNDGRIYVRVADSSNPTHLRDRATFDMLAERRREADERLRITIERPSGLGPSDAFSCTMHLFILSDPYETLGHRYSGSFDDFAQTMTEEGITFNNIFTSRDGFVAQALSDTPPHRPQTTWHFTQLCQSHITLELPSLEGVTELDMSSYITGREFLSLVANHGRPRHRVLDLNSLPVQLMALIRRHHELLAHANVEDSLYIRACFDNTSGTTPFVDSEPYLEHVRQWRLPVNQEAQMIVPPGNGLDAFIETKLITESAQPTDTDWYDGGVETFIFVLNAFGIPGYVMKQSAASFLQMHERRNQFIANRSS